MAFIFALLFLAGLGSVFSKWADKANEWNRKTLQKKEADIRMFFANLYVVTWQYYQQLEPKVIDELVQLRPRKVKQLAVYSKFSAIMMENTTRLYGENILDHCIKKAFEELRARGYPVYKANPNPERRSDPGYGFLPLSQNETYDISKDITSFRIRMKEPWDFYDWESGENACGDFPCECVPEPSDPRTFYLPVNVAAADRTRTETERVMRMNINPDLRPILWDIERLDTI